MISRSSLLTIALVLCVLAPLSSSADPTRILPQAVTDFVTTRMERIHHLYFHTTRMNFLQLSEEFQVALGDLGWAPPRPAYAYNKGQIVILDTNDAGEDFLFMHRRMIRDVNRVSTEAGATWRVVGWPAVPAPGDKNWPVPPAYEMPGQEGLAGYITFIKTDGYYWDTIKPAEDAMDDDYLRTVTLGELGAKLEFELHTWMHLRFSYSNTVGYRAQNGLDPVGEVDAKWDVPAYDWLADFYSAHVGSTFWKIHGWIEGKIEQWRVANGIDRVSWTGTWEGGPMSVVPQLYSAKPADDGQDDPSEDTETEGTDGSPVDIDDDTLAATIEVLVKLIRKNNGN